MARGCGSGVAARPEMSHPLRLTVLLVDRPTGFRRQRYQRLDFLHQSGDAGRAANDARPGTFRYPAGGRGQQQDRGSESAGSECLEIAGLVLGQRFLVEHEETHRSAPRVGRGLKDRRLHRTGTAGVVAHLAEGRPKQGAGPLRGHHEQNPRRQRKRSRMARLSLEPSLDRAAGGSGQARGDRRRRS